MGQLLSADLFCCTGENYHNLHCFSGADWYKHSANEDKVVTLLPDQSLLVSLRKTGLQTQKTPIVLAVISQKMLFFRGNFKHRKMDYYS